MVRLDSEMILKANETLTGHKATNEEKIRGIITDLKLLFNEENSGRTLKEDLADIDRDLLNLKERIDSEDNKDVYEEDKLTLGYSLDLIDHLYRIIKILGMEN